MLFLNIATGVVLVLLGMRYLRKGLDRLFGNQLIDWLQQMTKNRWQAFLGGIVAGVIAPSSNVVDMMNCLRRINSQLTSLAYGIVRDSPRSGENKR